eukprot:CAMPEP_0184324386 /NCGR_PEP_ID=MMETSP1049-20130417/134908_1 /TAXON_ID=77928 /ORGANISM="Proteomonas sulcata, Strain CCMP704" /LENGTH=56 /DNA_ID=CAMNT_0026646127 /DNA_START=86 /DNA_END=253 /DNA_ORIENTATION=-
MKEKQKAPEPRHDESYVPGNKPKPWLGVLGEDPQDQKEESMLKLLYGGGGLGFKVE